MKNKPFCAVVAILGLGFGACAWLSFHGRMLAAVAVLVVTFNIAAAIADLAKDEEERKQ